MFVRRSLCRLTWHCCGFVIIFSRFAALHATSGLMFIRVVHRDIVNIVSCNNEYMR